MKRFLPTLLILGSLTLPTHATAAPAAQARDGYFRTSDGVRLHYLEAGQGDPIIFIPGWTVPAWTWDGQIKHFAATNHVIALDPRSQGKSAIAAEGHYPDRRAKDIKELIDAKHLGRVILVGHSLAVTEELAYVEQFGTASLAGLVFIDQDFGPYDANPMIAGLIRGVVTNRRATLEQLGGWFFKHPQPPAYTKRLFDDCMKTPTGTAVTLLASRFGLDYHVTFNKIDVPVLYTSTPQFNEAGEWLKKTVPGARVEVFTDAGHVLFVDEADHFNSVLDAFAHDAFHAPAAQKN